MNKAKEKDLGAVGALICRIDELGMVFGQSFHHLPVSLCNDVPPLMLGKAFPSPVVQWRLAVFLIRSLSSDLVWCVVMVQLGWRHPDINGVNHEGPRHISDCSGSTDRAMQLKLPSVKGRVEGGVFGKVILQWMQALWKHLKQVYLPSLGRQGKRKIRQGLAQFS